MFDIALDLHKENTYGVVLDDKSGQVVWEGSFSSSFRAAKETLEYYFTKGTKVAIEATSCFYPIYDGLKSLNQIEVFVVNTTKLEKPAIKTDRRDALRIAHLLRRDELPIAFIPNKEIRLQRELASLRMRFVHSCTECKNRIHSILHKEGKRPIGVKDVFSQKGLKQLENLNIERKEELHEELDLLEILQRKQARIENQIDELIHKNSELNKAVELIDSIPGFAQTLAFVCATELMPISRFDSGESVAAYAGLYPCIDSSGGRTKHGGIRRVGRKLLRWALVEGAHCAGRTKSPIGDYYRKKSKQKKSNHASAIATANKLAKMIYEILSTEKPYNPVKEQQSSPCNHVPL